MTATCLWSSDVDAVALLEKHRSRIDTLELQLPGTTTLDERQLEQLKLLAETVMPISLSTVLPGETISGKQHPRLGYHRLNRLPVRWVQVPSGKCRLKGSHPQWKGFGRLYSQAHLRGRIYDADVAANFVETFIMEGRDGLMKRYWGVGSTS